MPRCSGTVIEEMQDVRLDDDQQEPAETANGVSHHELVTRSGISDDSLILALESSTAFYKAYEDLTAPTLALYVLGERTKSAQAATADLAAVRFQSKDYAMAASYFRQLAPFYARGEWTDLELPMLESYAECLNYLDRKEEYISIALKVLSKRIQQSRSENEAAGISMDTMTGSRSIQTKNWLSDVVAASEHLARDFAVPVQHYFSDLFLKPELIQDDGQDSFTLQLQLRHALAEPLKVSKVNVCLIAAGQDQRNELWLSHVDPFEMNPGLVTVDVQAAITIPGLYKLDKIAILAGKITFEYDAMTQHPATFPLPQLELGSTETHDFDVPSFIHIYPRAGGVDIRAHDCKDIHLEKTRSIEIELSSGENSIREARLSVRAATAGLRLHTAETELVDGEVAMRDKPKPGVIHFGEIVPKKEILLRIPYSIETDLQEIVVRLELNYTTDHGEFTFACVPRIAISLVVGVNVQDIFKQNALFSKFSIFTANGIPLRMHRNELGNTDDFAVDSPPLDPGIQIFARQPISLLASISSLHRSSDRPLQRKLPLHITYTSVDEEVASAVSSTLTVSLASSPFAHLSRLLLPLVLSALKDTLSFQDYETAALLQSIKIPPIRYHSYKSLRNALPKNCDSLLEWLHEWHQNHSTIPLSPSPFKSFRTLTIPVEVPTLHVLHTASLVLSPAAKPSQHLTLGNPIPAELHISYTRTWDLAPNPSNELRDFMYEVSAPADTWLIGRRRKGHFRAPEGEEVSFALLLMPQRTGHILLPGVEIRHVPPATSSEEAPEGDVDDLAQKAISCETDYRSQGVSVLVIKGFERVTVGLDHDTGANSAWVIETQGLGEG